MGQDQPQQKPAETPAQDGPNATPFPASALLVNFPRFSEPNQTSRAILI